MERQNGSYHINEHGDKILRDCELFMRRYGYGFFSPSLCGKYVESGYTIGEEPRDVWLPRETKELQQEVERGQSTLIVGGLGAGKSALLYGLRALYRDADRPYCYIDGHFTTTPPKKIRSDLMWAKKFGAVVCFDSLDYLAAGSRRIRKLPLEEHKVRSAFVIDELVDFIDSGNLLVGTSHSEEWLRAKGDTEILSDKWQALLSRLSQHQVQGVFEQPEELSKFYTSAGFTPEETDLLSGIRENSQFIDFLQDVFVDGPCPDAARFDEIMRSLSEYRITKLIALDNSAQSVAIRGKLSELLNKEIDKEAFFAELALYVLAKNKETKVKTGIK